MGWLLNALDCWQRIGGTWLISIARDQYVDGLGGGGWPFTQMMWWYDMYCQALIQNRYHLTAYSIGLPGLLIGDYILFWSVKTLGLQIFSSIFLCLDLWRFCATSLLLGKLSQKVACVPLAWDLMLWPAQWEAPRELNITFALCKSTWHLVQLKYLRNSVWGVYLCRIDRTHTAAGYRRYHEMSLRHVSDVETVTCKLHNTSILP